MNFITKNDTKISIVFFILTGAFIAACINNATFFQWVFERHQNPLSWYLRPLFLIPFCFFAYQRNWGGIAASIFCLFTSMFWFPQPASVSDAVKTFLQFEKDWLCGNWDNKKLILILTVPISFSMLGIAFWKRSLPAGIAVVVVMALGKMAWGSLAAGKAGQSIIVPATVGLIICIILICFGFKRLEKKMYVK